MSPTENPYEQHHHVGRALMAFSTVGLVLGAVMTARGVVSEGFIDGPSALAVGAVTFAVGFSLWNTGERGR
ncbi:MAG: hypothetical protein RL653_1905 [Pseudomonadota bacterium]|jgi:hypothetical protein